jgi:hypothetical protein
LKIIAALRYTAANKNNKDFREETEKAKALFFSRKLFFIKIKKEKNYEKENCKPKQKKATVG